MDNNKLTMDENEEIYALIDQYLTNQLSESERIQFEQRCLDDAVFAEEVKNHTQAEYAARSYASEQKKHELKAFFVEESTETTPVRKMRILRYVAAAAIVLMAVMGLYQYFYPPNPTLLDLYTANVEDETFSVRRSPNDDFEVEDPWEFAGKSFNEKDYRSTIIFIDGLLLNESFNERPKAHLFKGFSILFLTNGYEESIPEDIMQGMYKQAIRAFEQVSPESSFIEKAQWYTALAWLKADNREKAIEALEVVKDYPNHYRQAKAQDLLNQLASSP